MLKIYNKDAASFLHNGIGVLKEFTKNPLITEVLNGEYILEFEYAKNGYLSEHLVEENIVKANGQPFRISYIDKNLKGIKVLAKHIVFDLNKNFLENVAPTSLSGIGALEWVLTRTQFPHNFTVWSDVTTTESARYVRKNMFEALLNDENSIANRWGGEYEYDNYLIKLHTLRGEDRGLTIRHGKNLTGAEMKLDFSTVATRIMPQGNEELLLPEKYIDSPIIDNYVTPIVRKVEFDIGVDEDTTEEQALDLMRDAVNKLYDAGIDNPTISLKVDFIELSKVEQYKNYSNLEIVNLGDTVHIYIEELGIQGKARVVKVVYDCLKERNIKLEIGKVTPNFVNQQKAEIDKLNKVVEKVNPTNILNQAKENATQLLKQPFDGYIYFDDLGSMYLMDTNDINTAQSVWKFSLGGIGYSSTGINGTYELAITSDGAIVADFITTGTMSVARISGLSTTLDEYDGRIETIEISEGQILLRVEATENELNAFQTEVVNEYATISSLNTTSDSIIAQVSGELQQKADDDVVTVLQGDVSQLKLTSDELTLNIQSINNDGVNKVVTSTGFKFDEDGLSISKEGDEMNSLIDNTGLLVKRDEEEVLRVDNDGVEAENIKVRKFLVFGDNFRAEDYEGGIGFFFIGGEE